MTTTRSEQLTLLASHISQQAGIIETITRITLAKDDGSMDAAVADSKIAYWQMHVDAQQSDIDDCLANIAGLDMPDVLPAETAVDIPFQPAGDLPHEPTLLAVADAIRAGLAAAAGTSPVETIPEPTIVDDEAPATKKKAKG